MRESPYLPNNVPKPKQLIYSLDTETTGTDLWHGAEPYLVTFCDEGWNNHWYEWDVDPLTRKVKPDPSDVEEIVQLISDAKLLILQNAKFDVTALRNTLPEGFKWPWQKTRDTLISGHLLASSHPHDLESMSIEYLAIDPSRYELAMKEAVNWVRKLVVSKGSPIGDWRIAKEGLPEMPSAKSDAKKKDAVDDRPWKYDTWLPVTFLKWAETNERIDLVPEVKGWTRGKPIALHPWYNVTATYANADSATTLGVYKQHLKEIEHRKLEKIYLSRLPLPEVVQEVEAYGVTLSSTRLDELETKYREEAERAKNVCINIAKSYDYELEFAKKAGNNKSLHTFVFEVMKLPVIKRSGKTGIPSLDAFVIDDYRVSLPSNSRQLRFIENLSGCRKRGTALGFIESYRKFWVPTEFKDFYRVHPSINITGTDTLRGSSYNPNEQQISKKEGFNLRYCFGPAPGREWWSLDAQNIELRLPAYESGEPELIDLFERPNEPPYYGSTHLLNFHTVYDDIWDAEFKELEREFGRQKVEDAYVAALAKVGPHCKKKFASTWYQYCKNGGFAVQYGAVDRPEGTADRAFHRPGSHAKLKARFKKLEELNQKWIKYAEKYGYVETIPDRSVDAERGYPLICTRAQYGRIKPTIPLNYHTQSTAMQWMWSAMKRCRAQFIEWRRENFFAWIVMQVHDELVFDLPAGTGKEPWRTNLPRIQTLAAIMRRGGDDIGVPTPVGAEWHANNWAEGLTINLSLAA